MKRQQQTSYLVDLADEGTAESWSQVLGVPIEVLREAAAIARPPQRFVAIRQEQRPRSWRSPPTPAS